jgi:hypothetical protein
MAEFLLTAPDGSKYKVTAPDEVAAHNTFKRAQESLHPASPPYQEPPIELEPNERVLSLGTPKETSDQPPAEPNQPPGPSQADALARSIYSGGTMDFGDRISALQAASGLPEAPAALGPINTLYNMTRLSTGIGRRIAETLAPHIFGTGGEEAYNQKFAEERAANEEARQTYPKTYLAGTLIGGALTVPLLPELAPFRLAAGAKLAGDTLPVAKQAMNLATGGAGYGAATGAGSAPDVASMPAEAGKGAVIGALAGPVIGGAAQGAAGIAGLAAQHARAGRNPQSVADPMLARRLAADAQPGETAMDVARRSQAEMTAAQQQPIPQQLTMVDVAGPKTQSMGGIFSRDPYETGSRAIRFFRERHFGRNPHDPYSGDSMAGRINDAIEQTFGANPRVGQTLKNMAQVRKMKGVVLWEKAFRKRLNYDTPQGQELMDILERIPPEAKGFANRILSAEDKSGAQMIWRQNAKGEFELAAVPNLRQWQYIKRALTATIKGASTPGELKHAYTEGLLNPMLKNLDELVPEYKAARSVWAGDSEMMDALELGKDHFNARNSIIAEDIAPQFHALSGGEKEMYRVGAAEALRDKVNNAPKAADITKQIFNSRNDAKKVDIIAPTPRDRAFLTQFLGNESKTFESGSEAIGNSKTAGRIADDLSAGAKLVEGGKIVAQAASGYHWGLLNSVFNMLARVNPEKRAAVMEAARKVALNPDPAAVEAFIRRVEEGATSKANRDAIIGLLIKGAPRGALAEGAQLRQDTRR